jgi:hypothetical protein
MNVLWGGGVLTVYFPQTYSMNRRTEERDYDDVDSNRFTCRG